MSSNPVASTTPLFNAQLISVGRFRFWIPQNTRGSRAFCVCRHFLFAARSGVADHQAAAKSGAAHGIQYKPSSLCALAETRLASAAGSKRQRKKACNFRLFQQRLVEHFDPVPHRRLGAALQVGDAADVG